MNYKYVLPKQKIKTTPSRRGNLFIRSFKGRKIKTVAMVALVYAFVATGFNSFVTQSDTTINNAEASIIDNKSGILPLLEINKYEDIEGSKSIEVEAELTLQNTSSINYISNISVEIFSTNDLLTIDSINLKNRENSNFEVYQNNTFQAVDLTGSQKSTYLISASVKKEDISETERLVLASKIQFESLANKSETISNTIILNLQQQNQEDNNKLVGVEYNQLAFDYRNSSFRSNFIYK